MRRTRRPRRRKGRRANEAQEEARKTLVKRRRVLRNLKPTKNQPTSSTTSRERETARNRPAQFYQLVPLLCGNPRPEGRTGLA